MHRSDVQNSSGFYQRGTMGLVGKQISIQQEN